MQGGEARGRLSLKAAALILGRVHAARDPARRDERVHLGARLPFQRGEEVIGMRQLSRRRRRRRRGGGGGARPAPKLRRELEVP